MAVTSDRHAARLVFLRVSDRCRICALDRWRVCRYRAAHEWPVLALSTGHAIDCRPLLGAGQLEFGGAWVVGRYPGGCRGQLQRVAPVPADGGFFGDVEQVGDRLGQLLVSPCD